MKVDWDKKRYGEINVKLTSELIADLRFHVDNSESTKVLVETWSDQTDKESYDIVIFAELQFVVQVPKKNQPYDQWRLWEFKGEWTSATVSLSKFTTLDYDDCLLYVDRLIQERRQDLTYLSQCRNCETPLDDDSGFCHINCYKEYHAEDLTNYDR